jgi:hypothetical protein
MGTSQRLSRSFHRLALFLAGIPLFVGLPAMLAVRSANAAEPAYLRCAAGNVADPGGFLIIGVDPDRHVIRFTERGVILNSTITFRLTEMDDTTVRGSMVDKDGEELRLEIDRISGRVILYVDVTRASGRWRPDLKPDERLWDSMSYNCQRTKPLF